MDKKQVKGKKSIAMRFDREVAIDKFVQAILDGRRGSDAYILSHPHYKSTNINATRVRASEFARHPDVQKALKEARQELLERHAGFRDRLIEMLQEEISNCYNDNHTLAPVMKQVEVATRVLGMDKQTVKVEGDAGAFDRESAAMNLMFLVNQAKGGKQ